MSFEELVFELTKLNCPDKPDGMPDLITNQSGEENAEHLPQQTYQLVTPYGNEAAASVLFEVLQASNAAQ